MSFWFITFQDFMSFTIAASIDWDQSASIFSFWKVSFSVGVGTVNQRSFDVKLSLTMKTSSLVIVVFSPDFIKIVYLFEDKECNIFLHISNSNYVLSRISPSVNSLFSLNSSSTAAWNIETVISYHHISKWLSKAQFEYWCIQSSFLCLFVFRYHSSNYL